MGGTGAGATIPGVRDDAAQPRRPTRAKGEERPRKAPLRCRAPFDVRLGLRNAFNKSYSDPIALVPGVDTMPEPGRSFFVELIAHRAR